MQAPTATPREHLDPAVVPDLVHDVAGDVEVGFGAELVDPTGLVLADLSADLRSASVTWDGEADLHRSCTLVLAREVAWGRDQVRVHQELTSAALGVTARFWLGTFILTRPSLDLDGSDVVEHTAKGWDALYLLRSPVADTWATRWVETGQATTVAAEVGRVLRAAGYPGRVALAPAAASTLLPEPQVWPLDDGATTWLRVLIDILKAGGFTPPWADEAGVLRAEPLVPVEQRPVAWTLDADDPATIVGPRRSRVLDLASVPNSWRFVNASIETEPLPGQGIYDPPDNESQGPTSIAARRGTGFDGSGKFKKVLKLDAASQDALVRQGEEIRAKDIRAAGVRQLSVAPLPLLGHGGVVALRDAAHGPEVRAVLTGWGPYDLAGADVPLTLEEVP